MTVLAASIPVFAGGSTTITLCFGCERAGGTNDQCQMRVVRNDSAGANSLILTGTPSFIFPGDPDTRSWTWIDPNVPTTDTYSYTVQVNRTAGAGSFHEVVLTATHFRR